MECQDKEVLKVQRETWASTVDQGLRAILVRQEVKVWTEKPALRAWFIKLEPCWSDTVSHPRSHCVRLERPRCGMVIPFFTLRAMRSPIIRTLEVLALVWQSLTRCRSFSATSTTFATTRAETTSPTGCQQMNRSR